MGNLAIMASQPARTALLPVSELAHLKLKVADKEQNLIPLIWRRSVPGIHGKKQEDGNGC